MHAKRIRRQAKRIHPRRKQRVQLWIGDNHIARVAARDVEGFGGRRHHHQPVRNGGGNVCHDVMGLPGKHKVVVNFIRHQNKIMAHTEIGDALQFCKCPDPPARIVRRTQDQHLFRAGHLRVPGGKIHLVAPVVLRQFAFHHPASRRCDHPRERVVYRRQQDHPVTRCGKGIHTKTGAIHQPVRGENRVLVHVPAMAGFHPPPDRRDIPRIIAEIAIKPMLCHRLDRALHNLRWPEVHICNPHGKPGLRRDAIQLFHHVPLGTMGADPVDLFIKAHGYPACNSKRLVFCYNPLTWNIILIMLSQGVRCSDFFPKPGKHFRMRHCETGPAPCNAFSCIIVACAVNRKS